MNVSYARTKAKSIENMIKDGVATFNGFSSVEEAKNELAKLQAFLVENDDTSQLIENAKTTKVNEKIARHNRAQSWSRKAKNDYMREFGYKWSRREDMSDFDQYSEYEASYARFTWILKSSDGRIVTVEQAMNEIKEMLS